MTTQFRPQPTPDTSKPLADIAFPFTTFTLENGLTVIVAENHDVPLVSYQLIYQVGSKDEPAGMTGFAHLFEHLMFEGSVNAPGSFLENMMRAGATNLNAFTSTDRTTYHATVPTGSLDYALFMESDRMGHFYDSITQQSLDQQRRVVLNEKLETESGPYGKLYEFKSRGCFPAEHPYAHTVIGEKSDLVAATLDDVKRWFRKWYTPSNAVLALCGDIDVASAREKVTHWFGDIPPGQPVTRPENWIADIPPQRRDRYQAKVASGTLLQVWNIPPVGSADATLLSLAADYLASGLSSELVKNLVYEQKVASSVQAEIADGELCSQFIISATVAEGQTLAALERSLRNEVQRFLEEGCRTERLNEVKNDALNLFRDSYKTSAQIAALLSSSWVTQGDAGGFQALLNQVSGASPTDVQQAARRWLLRDSYTLEIEPFTAQPDEHAVAAGRDAPPAILPPVALTLPQAQHARLDNGIQLVLLERHSQNDIYLDLLLPGVALPQSGQHQLLIDLLNQAGAGERDAMAFSRACRDLGMRTGLRKRLHHLSLLLSCRSPQLADALLLLRDRLEHSILLEDDFLRQRALQLDALTEQRHVASALVERVLPGLMYPEGHLCRVAGGPEGTTAGLAQTELSELRDALPALLNVRDATLIVTGDTTLAQLLPQLNATLGRIPGRAREVAAIPQPAPPQQARVYLLDIPDAEQTSIAAASLLPGVHGVNEAGFELLNSIFASGFASRINLNLREDKNWTYGVKGQLINDPQQRVHYLRTEVQADRTCAAVEEILAEFRALTGDRPVTPAELEEVRRTSLLGFSSSAESLSGLNTMISWLARSGLPDDFWQAHQQRMADIPLGAIHVLAQQLFSPERLTWVIAGNISLFRDELAALLPVEQHVIRDGGDALYD
ncbi:TPA: insulinase family protein [Klebsiella pneumoniae]|uniref:M16 family metallopeptidase n=1 Tax=Klebsiella/Raoultella group TaxID=2890311 RepID=UPI0007CCD9B4|nr:MULTISPECIES: M16 family metallopeptidase [Klebsiella]HBR1319204.1 insulinase family protein [Klebsiella quasipneumoniae subsp. quasipneumoniae]ELW9393606.1 insulinase family protein [Klebsiella pneumoniae]MBM4744758.1 insulinase family protein [Klebsiella pneumoniae]MBU8944429.1 insulinase family protein [Klebsiella quasipneumoniae]MCH9373873.1 insulinase family protein [Klebsiella pneumoniae]